MDTKRSLAPSRWTPLVRAIALTALVAACGSGASPSAAPSAAPTAAQSTAPSSGGSAAPSTSAAACTGLPAEYKIGLDLGLTGWMAPYDTPAYEGFKLAVDEINAAGGIAGTTKIALTTKDNRTDAAEAAKVATELSDAGVDMMILPGDASLSIPSGQVAQKDKIPGMSLLASTATQRDDVGNYFFSNGQADTLAGAASAQYAIDNGYKTAFLLTSPDSPWLYLVQDYFKETFEKLGGKVVGSDEFRLGDTDFSAQIAKIKALDPQPDLIYSTIGEPEWPAFIRQLRAAGSTVHMIGSESVDTEATLSLGQSVDGTVAVTSGFPSPGDTLDKFYTHYKEATGKYPAAVFPAVGYDAAKQIAYAVEKACSVDRAAVRDSLDSMAGFVGVLGDYEFGTIPGFANRPVAVEKWTTDSSGKVTISKVADLKVKGSDVPKGRPGN